jgi:arylsulfatase A-like enzyme
MPVSRPNIICLAIDRLHVGYLGAYGNTWINTPALDRLASESLVLDRMMIDSPELQTLYRSWWQGIHAVVSDSPAAGIDSLPMRLTGGGWHTALITDESAVSSHPLAESFGERILVEPSPIRRNRKLALADGIEGTDVAAFFAEANGWLEESPRQPFFAWLHTGTLGRVWDAPLEFRAQYHDEDDPPPSEWAEVPKRIYVEEIDPDELLGARHAYAGQVTMIDELVGSLIETLNQLPFAADTLLIVVSPRGFPLGEHRRVGPCDDALYSELTHVPCFVRLPNNAGASQRTSAIVQPADIFATLLDCGGLLPPDAIGTSAGNGHSILRFLNESTSQFDRAVAISADNQCRIETPAWAMRVPAAVSSRTEDSADVHSPPSPELFVKPDDWCDVNEVSDRCPAIVEQLQAVLAEFRQDCETGEANSTEELPAELVSGLE